MKKKIVTTLTVLTILGETFVNAPNITFAVDEIDAKDQEINEIRAQESEMERNIHVIKGQIADREAEVDRLQGELEDAQRDLERLEREIAELNDRINKRHERIEKNARTLQLNKDGVWLNYIKVIFNKNSNWSQKISALTSIGKVMSSQRELIEQQKRDYTILQNKEIAANERVALIRANMERIQRNKEELERLQTDLEVEKLDLKARRASAEEDKQVLIARKEEAQRAAREVRERQQREFVEERAARQIQITATPKAKTNSTPIILPPMATVAPVSLARTGGYSGGRMQCTDYAAAKTGIGGLGNASQWAANAQAEGKKVDSTGEAGAVVAFNPGVAGASSYGHVGVVDSVNPDGTINMSEANYNGGFNKRVVDPRTSGVSIIHK
ncbi:MAG: CHAP domain-containing protein [Streptococcaceae bacterium]|nr:CHAP domain-containing protein [Streptococcaceae bacterium]